MWQRDNYGTIKTKLGRMVSQTQSTYLTTQVDQALQMAHEDIRRVGPWPTLLRSRPWVITTTARYNTGTVTVTDGSTTVTGSGTTFTAAMVGRKFRRDGDWREYIVATRTSNTVIDLDEAYENADLDGSGLAYNIYQDEYNLPAELESIWFVRQEKSNISLERRNLLELYTEDPTAHNIDTPYFYDISEQGVEAQPAGAGVLALSSNSTDDNAKVVLVRGVVTAVEDYEEITLGTPATTAVNSAKSFSRVDKIVKAASFTGRLLVTANSTNITVHRIPPELLSVDRKKLQFYPWPKDLIRVYVAGYRYPHLMIRNNDVPDVASDLYIEAGLVNLLRMSGHYDKAAQQLQVFVAKAEAEKHSQSRDSDSYMQMVLDDTYTFG